MSALEKHDISDTETSKLDKTIEKLERYANYLENKVKEKIIQAKPGKDDLNSTSYKGDDDNGNNR